MSAKTLIVSTCGTSLLTNNIPAEMGPWLKERTNLARLEGEDEAKFGQYASERAERFVQATTAQARRDSAEYNGLCALRARGGLGEASHVLVYTDTVFGRATAEGLERRLTQVDGEAVVGLVTAPGLRTDDLESFQCATSELTEALHQTLEGYRASQYKIIFNLTGGFKPVSAYLQALGMLWADECVFLFETSGDALVSIPRLPIEMDIERALEEHLEFARRAEVKYPPASLLGLAERMPESLAMRMDGQASWTQWGLALWKGASLGLMSKRVLEPLSPKVRLGPKVAKSFDALDRPDRKYAVNWKLDVLSAWMDGARKQLLAGEEFKPLKGDPCPPSTHEMDLWSKGGGGRLVGHYEGPHLFVVDDIFPTPPWH